jgi:hypothetical protein
LLREPGLEQPQFDQNEPENAPHEVGIGARDERTAAVRSEAGKRGIVAWEIGHGVLLMMLDGLF